MKKRTKIILCLAVACAGTLVLAACGGNGNPYERLKGIAVRYDANGGRLASRDGVTLTDVYTVEDVKQGVKLMPPDDSRRNVAGSVQALSVTNTGYFLAGWYSVRNLREDASGNALDEDGRLCSESGKPQGYIYANPWDFEKDIFRDEDAQYKEGEYALTLYAAWIPEYSYRIYGEVNGKWEVAATYSYDPLIYDHSEIALPEWNEDTGAMDYGLFPEAQGKTFSAVYKDAGKTEQLDKIVNEGTWDKATGVSVNAIAEYYADWRDGVWFKIRSLDQFLANVRGDGCYELYTNLDFSGEKKGWPAAFSLGGFSGTFLGMDGVVTLSNISVTQSDAQDTYGGIFGRILDGANFENVAFTNVVYSLEGGSMRPDSTFGLFAGNISTKAKATNVTVEGTLKIGKNIYTQTRVSVLTGNLIYNYEIGILSGNFVTLGISTVNIKIDCDKKWTYELDESGRITTVAAETSN